MMVPEKPNYATLYPFKGENNAFKLNMLTDHNMNMLNRTLGMFDYENLPKGLPEFECEEIIQTEGFGVIIKYKDGYTMQRATGVPVSTTEKKPAPLNEYYEYRRFRVLNPMLEEEYNREYEDGVDCIVIRNLPLWNSILPIFNKWGTLLLEGEITLKIALYNIRKSKMFTANNKAKADALNLILEDIDNGIEKVITDKTFDEVGIKTLLESSGASNEITQLIEAYQYIKACEFQELGLDSNYNMKRERIQAGEAEMNMDILRPLIDAMLEVRQQDWDRFNEWAEEDVTVKFKGIWSKYNEDELLIEGDILEESDEEISEEPIDESENDDIIKGEEIQKSEEQSEENTEVETENSDETTNEDESENIEESESNDLETVAEIIEDIKEIVEDITEATNDEVEDEKNDTADDAEATN